MATYLFDSQSLSSTLVSGVNGSGQVTGDQGSIASIVVSDGSVVVLTMADNLIAGVAKADGSPDLFISDSVGQPPRLVTQSAFQPAPESTVCSSSADGRYVVFTSNATNVVPGEVDTNDDQNVYLLDRSTSTTVLVSHTPDSARTTGDAGSPGSRAAAKVSSVPAVISADGNYVAFISSADNLVPDQFRFPTSIYTNRYLYSVNTGQVTLISG
jgi:Tol biopolymer transport system component